MPKPRFFRPKEAQVDPFNAGDPIMPGGEPDVLDGSGASWGAPWETGGTDDAPGYAPHGEQGGEPHKPDDNYQAPTTAGHDYDAPSIDEVGEPPSPTRRPARSRRQRSKVRPRGEVSQRGAGRAGRRLSGCLVMVIFIAIALAVVSALAALTLSGVTDEDPGAVDAWSWERPLDDTGGEAAIREAVGQQLDELLADPTQGPLHDALASHVDEFFLSWEGRDAAALGIDADAWATSMLSSVSCSTTDAYDFRDGTGSVYFEVSGPAAGELLYEADDEIYSYLSDNDLLTFDDEEPPALTDAQCADVRALWDAVMDGAVIETAYESRSDVLFQDGTWRADPTQLQETIISDLGIY